MEEAKQVGAVVGRVARTVRLNNNSYRARPQNGEAAAMVVCTVNQAISLPQSISTTSHRRSKKGANGLVGDARKDAHDANMWVQCGLNPQLGSAVGLSEELLASHNACACRQFDGQGLVVKSRRGTTLCC